MLDALSSDTVFLAEGRHVSEHSKERAASDFLQACCAFKRKPVEVSDVIGALLQRGGQPGPRMLLAKTARDPQASL